jgi:hypothetical protein
MVQPNIKLDDMVKILYPPALAVAPELSSVVEVLRLEGDSAKVDDYMAIVERRNVPAAVSVAPSSLKRRCSEKSMFQNFKF